MELKDAEAYLHSCAASARAMATAAIRNSLAALEAKGHRVVGACVLAGSGPVGTSLKATLASHPLIHAAEGEFFRGALKQAYEGCSLALSVIKERELLPMAAAKAHLTVAEVQRRVSNLGKQIGPAWRQDEKLCALAAWTWLVPGPPNPGLLG